MTDNVKKIWGIFATILGISISLYIIIRAIGCQAVEVCIMTFSPALVIFLGGAIVGIIGIILLNTL